MVHIDSTKFGNIVIDGRRYKEDVFIFIDGSIKDRKGMFFDSKSHEITQNELDALLKDNPEIIIIGKGQWGKGRLNPSEEVVSSLKERGVKLINLPTPKAIQKFNEFTGKKVAALIHITC